MGSLSLLLGCWAALAGCSRHTPTPTTGARAGRAEGAATGTGELGRLQGTLPASVDTLVASDWRYREGTCTEGILDMSVRGFSETLRVQDVPGGLVLVFDRVFAEDGCAQTVTLHARRGPAESPDTRWYVREHARVSYPDSERCERVAQEDAPGDLRMRGQRLELFLRRSPWCGGYEARLVYDPVPPAAHTDAGTTLRHFVAAFHDRDSLALVDLYSASGAHEDPHRPDEAGRPMRHVGRAALEAYYATVFHQTPWLAFRLRSVEEPEEGESAAGLRAVRLRARVEYMDPRLDAPRAGALELELVDGRIFESRLRILEATSATGDPGSSAAPLGAAP